MSTFFRPVNKRCICPLPLPPSPPARIRLAPCERTPSRAYSSIENGDGSSNGHNTSNGHDASNGHGLANVEKVSIVNAKYASTNGNGIGSDTSTRTDSLSGSNSGGRLLEAGEVAGDYSQDWKSENGGVSVFVFFSCDASIIFASGIFCFARLCPAQRTIRDAKESKVVMAEREQRRCSVLFTFVRV